MNYRKKYLKYKLKYMNFKNKLRGGMDDGSMNEWDDIDKWYEESQLPLNNRAKKTWKKFIKNMKSNDMSDTDGDLYESDMEDESERPRKKPADSLSEEEVQEELDGQERHMQVELESLQQKQKQQQQNRLNWLLKEERESMLAQEKYKESLRQMEYLEKREDEDDAAWVQRIQQRQQRQNNDDRTWFLIAAGVSVVIGATWGYLGRS